MRGLFLKIFAILWLAQSLVFVITTVLIVRQHFPGPSMVAEALDSSLRHTATTAVNDYGRGGCAAFAANADRNEPAGALLLDGDGNTLCRTAGAPQLAGQPLVLDRIDGRIVEGHYVWVIPVAGNAGERFGYLWFQPPPARRPGSPRHDRERDLFGALRHFAFPQVPVAIAIGGLATFVLVLLFSRPIVRLRKATRELAAGNLDVRVEQPPAAIRRSGSDEFQGLIHDFNHMAERLESLVGAQKLLLRDVSHELRSPLARLSVALELAHEDATEPELDEHLARIEREAERLNQLIGQLLTLSALEAREVRESTESFQPVSLNGLLEELLPDAEYEAQQRKCTVSLEESAQCTVRGDRALLYRAIENVVRNAIRYTDAGTAVGLRLSEMSDESNGGRRWAVVEIEDHGPGIPEAELEQIFQPFYRVDRSRTASTGGFGVGLAITERAVRLHGGSITARNRAEGGALVRMVLPLG